MYGQINREDMEVGEMSRAYLNLDAEIRKHGNYLHSRRQTISDELARRAPGLPAERYTELSIEELLRLQASVDAYLGRR